MKAVLRVHKKGIIILPKRIREALGIDEGDEVIVEVNDGELIMRALKPEVVDVDPKLVEKILREEYELEKRYTKIMPR